MWYESKKKSSSSGGGHTILDDTGTALAQESNLQFNGAYVYDDSTHEKTIVDVSRVMTRARFDALTDDEKKGVIVISDEEGSDNAYVDIIGTLRSGNTTLTLYHGDITEDCVISVYTGTFGVNPYEVNPYIGSVELVFDPQPNDVQVLVRVTQTSEKLNKRTDYSTSEQNTGVKWIDGNDVFQRTYTGTIATTGITVLDSDVSDITVIGQDTWLYDANGLGTSLGMIPNSSTWINCLHINANHELCLHSNSAVYNGTYYVTIKYIKNS